MLKTKGDLGRARILVAPVARDPFVRQIGALRRPLPQQNVGHAALVAHDQDVLVEVRDEELPRVAQVRGDVLLPSKRLEGRVGLLQPNPRLGLERRLDLEVLGAEAGQ